MAKTHAPDPVKHFAGVLYSDDRLLDLAIDKVSEHFGEIDYISPSIPFDMTAYYEDEMGETIFRMFVSFKTLITPDYIVESKLITNKIEEELAIEGNRKINLDTGYMDYHKVVLASAKFGGQKVYVGKGIYADINLLYEKGGFTPFVWTFPDFKSGNYDDILMKIRAVYKKQRRSLA
jgi:hypothetical protein